MNGARWWRVTAIAAAMVAIAVGQGAPQKRTLVINGQSGEASLIEINGRSYIDLETLARIANGTLAFQGEQIILTLPGAGGDTAAAPVQPGEGQAAGMSDGFMKAAVQALGTIKQWRSAIAYALQHGIPGDGSRVFIVRDRAAEGLRMATVAASTDSDQNARQLLANHFDNVSAWSTQMVEARRSMSTANYSMSPDALNNDAQYQKIARCSDFLGTMLASGKFEDEAACH